MIQAKMNVLEKVGLSESNLSDNAVNASFHSKVNACTMSLAMSAEIQVFILTIWICPGP